eukprot:gb/GEZJ01003092.1/.p1 GENE.gb/GEZJ01003092.1/~~gb/GEZJ01003092.1/.p1  ORF type:complete len:591 (-),score=95.05 gb/GEZJ01003092.1/:1232-2833(-)
MDSANGVEFFVDGFPALRDTSRFLNSLSAASPPLNFTLSSLPDDLNALPYEMPLAHALASDTLNLTAPLALPIPNNLDIPFVKSESDPPVSALTAASLQSSASTVVPNAPICNNKPRPAVRSCTPAAVAALRAALPNHNFSSASDVSSNPLPRLASPDSNSASTVSDWNLSTANSEPNASTAPSHALQSAACSHGEPKSCKNQLSPEPQKSHTRRCREKVTRQFEHLLDVLPPPPPGVEVKHKAQILDYTINVFRSLLARRTSLQTHIALASSHSVLQWATSILASHQSNPSPDLLSISTLLDPFMGFYCVKNSWTYAETWITSPESTHASLCSCVINTENPHLSASLNAFATSSKARYQPPSSVVTGIISRVRQTKRPEWLTHLPRDESVFDRANIAAKHNVTVALAVPVIAFDKCLAVILFADVNSKPFSAAAVDQLFQYTAILAECFVRHPRESFSPQQTVVTVSSGGQLYLSPGTSVDADSSLGPLARAEADLSAPHALSSATALLVPQPTQGSSKGFLEETQAVGMKY